MKRRKMALAVAIAAAVSMLAGCGRSGGTVTVGGGGDTVTGSGKAATKDFEIPDGTYQFAVNGINSSDTSVTIEIASSGNSAAIEADDNVIDDFMLNIDESAGTITLAADSDKTYEKVNCSVVINAAVSSIEAAGAAEITYAAPEGAEEIKVSVSGACSVNASGTCKKAKYEVSGASYLEAEELQAEEVNIEASGTSNASVYASTTLDANVSGVSSGTGYGDPDTVNEDVSGMSKLEKK